MKDIKFSIVIALYNKENYILKTIKSIINSFELCKGECSYEIVIIDDGSTDNSANVIKELKSEKIKTYYQTNSGVSSARNAGIKYSQGEYIVFCDADDIVLNNYAEFLDDATGFYTDNDVFVAYSQVIRDEEIIDSEIYARKDVREITDFFVEWEKKSFFSMSSLCVKKEFITNNDLSFDKNISSGEDLIFFFKIGLLTKIIAYDKPAVIYYKGIVAQLSATPDLDVGEHTQFLFKIRKECLLSQETLKSIDKIIDKQMSYVVVDNLLMKNYVNALRIIYKRPRMLKNYKIAMKVMISCISRKFFLKISNRIR